MKKSRFRANLLYTLFASKIIIIAWIFFMEFTGGYSSEQMTDLLLIIAPLVSTNIMIGLQYYGENHKNAQDGEEITPSPFKNISFMLLGIYFIFMMGVISSVNQEPEAFKTTKTMLSIGELLFGGYIGYVVKNIFK